MKNKFISMSLLLLIIAVGVWFAVEWTINRVYVDQGFSLQLRYKGPVLFGSHNYAQQGHWAKEGEIGVLEKLRGPGRHFYCPIWWERTIVPDILVEPGEVGLVTCKLGDPPPEGEFLVDGEIGEANRKGPMRRVLSPGRYRINPYGYGVSLVKTVINDSGKTKNIADGCKFRLVMLEL